MNTSPSHFESIPSLTARQLDVLKLRAKELKIGDIMDALVISEATVKKHLRAIYEKLGVSDSEISTFERLRVVQEYAAWLDQQEQTGEPYDSGDDPHAELDANESEHLPIEAELVLLWDEFELSQRARFNLQPVGQHRSEPILLPRQPARRASRPILLGIGMLIVAGVLGGVLGGGATYYLMQQGPSTQVRDLAQVALAPNTEENEPVEPASGGVSTELPPYASRCGEPVAQDFVLQPEFVHSQGVINYTAENSGGAILSNFVRSLAVDDRGLWIGYFPESGAQKSGLGFTTKKQWLSCNFAAGVTDQLVNDLLIDRQGNIWVATETAGVSRYDGESWHSYGETDGLPSRAIYGLGLDDSGQVWAGTWEGVAVFVDGRWEVPYSVANDTIFNNHVHAIAFDSQQNIWIGHIGAGISEYDNVSGTWIHHTVAGGNLGGDHTRDILVRQATESTDESVWIATADGGVTRFENGRWTVYRTEDGLPSNDVVSLALDRYDRVWAATMGGVAYFDGTTWQLYHTLPATAVAIGLHCDGCPIDDDMVWTATRAHGLTYSKLPLDTSAVDVLEVRYPKVVAPGERFRPEIVVAPRSPYELREDRGDLLAHIDADEANRFGAWQHMPVKDIVRAGEPFTFTDHDRLFVAPQLGEDETEKTFTSTWRVWMHTRFVGPPIKITFTVKKPNAAE